MSALKGDAGKDAIPDDVVQIVLDKVKAEGGSVVASTDAEAVPMALEQMKLREVFQGKAGVGDKSRKETGGHKVRVFWSCCFKLGCTWSVVLINAARAATR